MVGGQHTAARAEHEAGQSDPYSSATYSFSRGFVHKTEGGKGQNAPQAGMNEVGNLTLCREPSLGTIDRYNEHCRDPGQELGTDADHHEYPHPTANARDARYGLIRH